MQQETARTETLHSAPRKRPLRQPWRLPGDPVAIREDQSQNLVYYLSLSEEQGLIRIANYDKIYRVLDSVLQGNFTLELCDVSATGVHIPTSPYHLCVVLPDVPPHVKNELQKALIQRLKDISDSNERSSFREYHRGVHLRSVHLKLNRTTYMVAFEGKSSGEAKLDAHNDGMALLRPLGKIVLYLDHMHGLTGPKGMPSPLVLIVLLAAFITRKADVADEVQVDTYQALLDFFQFVCDVDGNKQTMHALNPEDDGIRTDNTNEPLFLTIDNESSTNLAAGVSAEGWSKLQAFARQKRSLLVDPAGGPMAFDTVFGASDQFLLDMAFARDELICIDDDFDSYTDTIYPSSSHLALASAAWSTRCHPSGDPEIPPLSEDTSSSRASSPGPITPDDAFIDLPDVSAKKTSECR